MAKARWANGLRRGSTKSTTYSTLTTAKEGKIQIVKDRVYDIANPQTINQMIHRVIFATVTKAAEKLLPLIGISIEGISNITDSRRKWISLNVSKLDDIARSWYRNPTTIPYAAYGPKGNQQLIPNSFVISYGSLQLPDILVPKTNKAGEKKGSFESDEYDRPFYMDGDNYPFEFAPGSYTAADLFLQIFGLLPGDQITFPQIYAEGIAQSMSSGSTLIDCTRYTDFCAPRICLKSDLSGSFTVTADSTVEGLWEFLTSYIDEDKSWMALWDNITDSFEGSYEGGFLKMFSASSYSSIYGINDDDLLIAIGCILSRKDENTGKWKYSTSSMVCLWSVFGTESDPNDYYFGFTLDNAIETYKKTARQTIDGNFLQSGGDSDIIPESRT